ncbi:hypothetical protein B0A50_00553 [Salinomyces thailandicus]|uniref:Uncharacterized protein n=1 Tax=Salinomyces thailandicus TaxID=706561 RepID=A0A4U0UEL7_9PEZI|nr:hypothetical protein B0A50_00553 [Salinomyces thailandica]
MTLTGSQDSCVDVQHKKRGRPRLREEGHLRNEPDLSPQSSAPSGPSQPGVRPIAGVRHRRGESFRSLRSQTSDGSPSYTASTPSTYLPTVPRQSPYGMQLPPTPSSAHPTYDVATALLNLDFVIIRANRPFQQIMLPGQDLRGRQIADVAAPADNEGFQSIRNRLRTEREAREPAYMPPIMQLGQDPVQDMPEAEAEQYTHGFQDNTYTWTHTRLGPASQQFPVRVRLAKANTYFVVVTLPSFRPIEPAPHQQQPPPLYSGPLALGPPLQPPERFLPPRHAAQSAPPQGYMPFQGVMAPPQPQHLPTPSHLAQGARTYPPPPQPQMMAYQDSANAPYQPFAPGTPRLPVAEPPTETTAFTPRTVPRELIPGTRASALQLPPIVPGPAGPAAGGQDGEEEEEGEEEQGMRSPKKRRRVGIHDVLQR